MDVLPRLISSVRVIYSISTYYNTSERLTSLFVKITNQLITTCRAFVARDTVQRLWELPHAELIDRLRQCIQLNDEYQRQFRIAKDCIQLNDEYQRQFRIAKDRLKETPEERQFEFRSDSDEPLCGSLKARLLHI